MSKTLIVIVGPTAAGKTELAIAVAKKFHTEIISADARQFFSDLNIGVSRPTAQQLSEVKHHFIAFRSVTDEYTAGEFGRDALKCLEKIFKKHHVAVMAGGSGLYVKAVCEGLDEVPRSDKTVRAQLEKELKEKGLKPLQDELKKADPAYCRSADVKNPRRVLRALEVYRTSGKPFSSFHRAEKQKRNFQIIKVGLTMERAKLYERISQRVDAMLEQGLLEEARRLLPLKHLKALQTPGYQELFDYLEGKTNLASAVSLIKQNTRNYAKRQLTWFRKDKDVKWFEAGQINEIMKFVTTLL